MVYDIFQSYIFILILNFFNQQEYNYVWKVENGEIVKEYVTIHKTPVATGTTYILDGVEVGDKVLK